MVDETRIDLDRRTFATVMPVTKTMLTDVHIEQMEDMVRDMIVFRMTKAVYGHRLAEWDQQYEVPKNWWQHLLSQLGLPHKTVRRSYTITRWRLYPDFPVIPRKYAGVSYLQEERTEW